MGSSLPRRQPDLFGDGALDLPRANSDPYRKPLMSPIIIAYSALGFAIVLEVTGSTFLLKSEQFTRPWPTVVMTLCYVASFYMLSQALKVLPLGIAYAIWAGLGIILTSVVGFVVLRQSLDMAAWFGIGLIVAGVIVINAFSRTVGH